MEDVYEYAGLISASFVREWIRGKSIIMSKLARPAAFINLLYVKQHLKAKQKPFWRKLLPFNWELVGFFGSFDSNLCFKEVLNTLNAGSAGVEYKSTTWVKTMLPAIILGKRACAFSKSKHWMGGVDSCWGDQII